MKIDEARRLLDDDPPRALYAVAYLTAACVGEWELSDGRGNSAFSAAAEEFMLALKSA